MRIYLVLAILCTSLAAGAAQLDLAVIQFPEVKTTEELNAALANVKLAEITNADRTMTSESYLKGGYVVFAQSLPLVSRFVSSTRLSNNRAEVDGDLAGTNLRVTIKLSEGVAAGLRRFSSRTYEANAPLSPGQPKILSIRQVSAKIPTAIRGQVTMKESSFCTVIIGQISK
jgi:hypothetical protein